MVQRALSELPAAFRDRIANLDIAVEERAQRPDYARSGTPHGRTLLGVYRGVPLSRRTHGYNLTLPDRIVIFQGPLERHFHPRDIPREVQVTVVHELAHHFGIDDERLRALGLD